MQHHLRPSTYELTFLKGNVLVSDQGIPYLSGFSLSRALHGNEGVATSNEMRGSLRWMSPERCKDDGHVSENSDVWAYGMVLLVIHLLEWETSADAYYQEVFSGMVPYADVKKDVQVFLKINNGDIPSRPQAHEVHGIIDDDMWSLCLRCWDARPEARPSMEEVLASLRARTYDSVASRDKLFSRLSLNLYSEALTKKVSNIYHLCCFIECSMSLAGL